MSKIFRWTLLLVVLVIFTSGAVAFYTVFFRTSDSITMPLMRNMSLMDAEREARRLGLNVNAETVVSTLPQGQVVVQFPEAGERVRSGSTIILNVSRGGARQSIPDVRRLTVSEAQNVLQGQGFSLGNVVRIQDDSRPGGTVIAQSPAAPANVPSDIRVDLLVSQGGTAAPDAMVMVPDVAGLPQTQARELLLASGFRIANVTTAFSPRDISGHVIGTRPAGGTPQQAGSRIGLTVATHVPPAGTPNPVQPVVQPPAQGTTLVGNEPPRQDQMQMADLSISVFDQQRQPVTPQAPTPTTQPVATPEPTQPIQAEQAVQPITEPPQPVPVSANLTPAAGSRIARIRYPVPPLAQPLPLRIELTDPSGRRVLLNREVRSGEYISLDAPFTTESVVRFYLGDQFVWQDTFR